MIRPILLAALLALPVAAQAADARRDAVIADYAAQARKADPAFAGFSAQRGEALFRAKWTGGDARTPSCTTCHTDNPKAAGQNAKTGRTIEPVAVSVNPKRFVDMAEVEKQFGRDCKNVIGRDCTVVEKGDYVTFMAGQ
jgi:mono/diheme cytochrome c family protein